MKTILELIIALMLVFIVVSVNQFYPQFSHFLLGLVCYLAAMQITRMGHRG